MLSGWQGFRGKAALSAHRAQPETSVGSRGCQSPLGTSFSLLCRWQIARPREALGLFPCAQTPGPQSVGSGEPRPLAVGPLLATLGAGRTVRARMKDRSTRVTGIVPPRACSECPSKSHDRPRFWGFLRTFERQLERKCICPSSPGWAISSTVTVSVFLAPGTRPCSPGSKHYNGASPWLVCQSLRKKRQGQIISCNLLHFYFEKLQSLRKVETLVP